jgi:CheY-like chemotaxis protein
MGGVTAVVSLREEAGGQRRFAVVARNLSNTGLGLLHGSFIHPGSACAVGLRRLDGGVSVLEGVVRRCVLVECGVYEIGVEFLSRVNAGEYVCFGGDQSFRCERVDPGALSATVLHVSDSRIEQRMLAHQYKDSSIDLLHASSLEEACEMMAFGPRLILVDHSVGDWSGVEMVSRLREAGAAVPILLMSAERWEQLREPAAEAGADEVLAKPFSEELLHRATAEYLDHGDGGDESGSIHYEVASASRLGMDLALLEEFVGDLVSWSGELEGLLAADDLVMLRRRAMEMRGVVSDFGFPTVAAWTDELLSALSSDGREDVEAAVERLVRVCGRCRASA